jgi:hypothetical protein
VPVLPPIAGLKSGSGLVRIRQKPALGRIAKRAYCVCMGRVFIPIFSVLAAATVALLSELVAHDGFGIATDAIRTDALRAAACAVIVLTFGILVKRDRTAPRRPRP